jgi:hypothetical protein
MKDHYQLWNGKTSQNKRLSETYVMSGHRKYNNEGDIEFEV